MNYDQIFYFKICNYATHFRTLKFLLTTELVCDREWTGHGDTKSSFVLASLFEVPSLFVTPCRENSHTRI